MVCFPPSMNAFHISKKLKAGSSIAPQVGLLPPIAVDPSHQHGSSSLNFGTCILPPFCWPGPHSSISSSSQPLTTPRTPSTVVWCSTDSSCCWQQQKLKSDTQLDLCGVQYKSDWTPPEILFLTSEINKGTLYFVTASSCFLTVMVHLQDCMIKKSIALVIKRIDIGEARNCLWNVEPSMIIWHVMLLVHVYTMRCLHLLWCQEEESKKNVSGDMWCGMGWQLGQWTAGGFTMLSNLKKTITLMKNLRELLLFIMSLSKWVCGVQQGAYKSLTWQLELFLTSLSLVWSGDNCSLFSIQQYHTNIWLRSFIMKDDCVGSMWGSKVARCRVVGI